MAAPARSMADDPEFLALLLWARAGSSDPLSAAAATGGAARCRVEQVGTAEGVEAALRAGGYDALVVEIEAAADAAHAASGFAASLDRPLPVVPWASAGRDGLAVAIERARAAVAALRRRRAEDDLRRCALQQQVVAELGLAALSSKHLPGLMESALVAVRDTLEIDAAALWAPVPDRLELKVLSGVGWCGSLTGQSWAVCVDDDRQASGSLETTAIEALRRRPVDALAAFEGREVATGLAVAVHGADAPLGALAVYAAKPRGFTHEDVNFLQGVANVLAGAIVKWIAEEDQIKSQKHLQSVQRMEAIGRLAGGIAHDFNTLVQAIGGSSEILLKRLPDDHPLRRNVQEIKKAGDRAAGLTRQLLAFSRQQVLQPKVIDLNTVVSSTEDLLRRLIGEHIELRSSPAVDLWKIKADIAQVEQVLMNLAVNARDAMEDGGTLSITTANVELPEPGRQNPFPVQPGPYVMLAVEDSGCGMTPEIRARAFDPYFTTKEPGKGTGLGLSTVYGIVKQSGGYIWVDSEPDKGTRVRICLPRATEVAAPLEKRRPAPATVPRGSETVLVVEDEEVVRELMREWLEAHGYRVLAAANGADALALSGGHAGPIDVLVADVVMPKLGGPALTKQLLPLRPDMKVIYISGYADEALGDRRVLEAGAAFLQKPFTLDNLVRKVREILDVPVGAP
jgi:signal transduction histidine kinase